jgi:hypothetical protein
LSGGYSYTRFETPDGERLFARTEIDLRTTWFATAFLTLTGDWSVGREAGSENVRQSYNLSYTPGPKLSISAIYQEFETLAERVTASDAVSASYRVNNHLSLFANLSRSRLGQADGESDEITSLRTGLRLFY